MILHLEVSYIVNMRRRLALRLARIAQASTGGGSDFYFLGMPGTPLENDLMNGMGLKPGVRYDLSPVDIGILTDVGWIERKIPKLPGDLNDDGIVSNVWRLAALR